MGTTIKKTNGGSDAKATLSPTQTEAIEEQSQFLADLVHNTAGPDYYTFSPRPYQVDTQQFMFLTNRQAWEKIGFDEGGNGFTFQNFISVDCNGPEKDHKNDIKGISFGTERGDGSIQVIESYPYNISASAKKLWGEFCK